MKSVKDISLALDVSTTTVYNHIKKLNDKIKPYIFEVKGIIYLNDEGIKQLKISMGQIQVAEVKENISMENIIDEISNKVSEEMKEDNKELNNKIDTLTLQVEKLTEQLNKKTVIDKIKDIFK